MGRVVPVILLSFVYCVLSQISEVDKSICGTNIAINKERVEDCFKNIVHENLDHRNVSTCKSVEDFNSTMTRNYNDIKNKCNATDLIVENDLLVDFINVSLDDGKNGTFKELYESDLSCVVNHKTNISACVNNVTGFFFNVSEETNSIYNFSQINLSFDNRSCDMAEAIKACTEVVLNSCKPTTRQYVASLFNFTLEICQEIANETASTRNFASSPLPAIIFTTIAVIMALTIKCTYKLYI